MISWPPRRPRPARPATIADAADASGILSSIALAPLGGYLPAGSDKPPPTRRADDDDDGDDAASDSDDDDGGGDDDDDDDDDEQGDDGFIYLAEPAPPAGFEAYDMGGTLHFVPAGIIAKSGNY